MNVCYICGKVAPRDNPIRTWCGPCSRAKSVDIYKRRRDKYGSIISSYNGMIGRCHNPSAKDYPRYGGRGIYICDEWRGHFDVFREWSLANGYHDGLTIDRVDNDKGYSPSNCQWITISENVRDANLRRRRFGRSEIALVFDLRERGLLYKQISKIVGCSKTTIQGILTGLYYADMAPKEKSASTLDTVHGIN